MVSSQSFTELQLLKSEIALSISGGLFKLRNTERDRERETDGYRWKRKINGKTNRLVRGSGKMRKISKK